jgi:hypothetical protein
MKTARNIFLLFVGLMLFSAVQARAAQVQDYSVDITDTRPGVTSPYLFSFKVGSSQLDLRWINLRWCTTPSGTCTQPGGVDFSGASKGTFTGTEISPAASWDLTMPAWGLRLENNVDGDGRVASPSATTPVTLAFSGIKNTAIDDCQAGGDVSSDTCFVRIEMVNSTSTIIDVGVSTYTIVQGVTVTARVDPLFTFVVAGVADSVVNNGITTSVTSTYSTLPFSNLTAGTPRYAAHSLTVTTNTQGGYAISHNMLAALTGVYGGNNIDPFIAPYGSPTTWTEPTGTTPSDNTGWLGFNTTDTDLAAYTSGIFGPVDSTDRIVMQAASSDPGTTPIFISYGLEANVFQPADTYTGTLIYIALPVY